METKMETLMFDIQNKYQDRYVTACNSIRTLLDQAKDKKTALDSYVLQVGTFVMQMDRLMEEINEDYFTKHSFEELLSLNHRYYEDIIEDSYGKSYADPAYCSERFSEGIGEIMAYLYTQIRQFVAFAFEKDKASMTWNLEVFLKAVRCLQEGGSREELIRVLKADALLDIEDKLEWSFLRRFSTEFNCYNKMVKNIDLSDRRYVFRYGMYIAENEIKLLDFFEQLEPSVVEGIARTYVEAFVRGFERNDVDLTKKKTVNMGYHIGFEPMMQKAYALLQEHGLEPLVYYDIKGVARPRIMNTRPSKQMEYDHRFDDSLYFTQELSDLMMKTWEKLFARHEEKIRQFAGPAIVEVFGERPFVPVNNEKAISYTKEMQGLKGDYTNSYQSLFSNYLPGSDYSFVLISYPLPEIHPSFEKYREIFKDTMDVNNLDEEKYMKIQQTIIEALDQGVAVFVSGRNGNHTKLRIALNTDFDVKTQTNFNNCTADVNVPVGEVFTSPKLVGTNGVLHVKEVYLNGLLYKDLEIEFSDGMMSSYTCKNFDEEEKNVNYVMENLTQPHQFLPLGEFAIGTNTTAYAMAKKHGIERIIPILIGEKMGPHFAIGDTCYTWSEDTKVYNPDGREIVARENEKTCLRKNDPKQAYTYKHTDITIPYSELDAIVVENRDGTTTDIIREGRFVLENTLALNEPLQNIEI